MRQNTSAQSLEAAEVMADISLLSQQIGSPEGVSSISHVVAMLNLQPVADLPSLRSFLAGYQAKVLIPLELPCIHRAFNFALRGEIRELVEFDKLIGKQWVPEALRAASRSVGQRQLNRLRPLKDHRAVQRYLKAIEENQATGWHTLVYGLVLTAYQIPLRQGLLHYAMQTQMGFLGAATQHLMLTQADLNSLQHDIAESLTISVEKWFETQSPFGLTVL